MAVFLALIPESGRGRQHTNDVAVVAADNATEALEALNSNGTTSFVASDLTEVDLATADDFTGLTARVTVSGAAAQDHDSDADTASSVYVFEYAAADSDGSDEVGAGLAAAINAQLGAGSATYTAGTQTLTIVGSEAALGDGVATYVVYYTGGDPDAPLTNPSAATITDEQTASDDIDIVLPAETVQSPNVAFVGKTQDRW